jgi:nicotinamidase-related amidase
MPQAPSFMLRVFLGKLSMLNIQNCCLIVVDLQGKLAQLMHDKDTLFKNIEILIKSAKILNIPILWCQQCPESLGPTIPQIAQLLSGIEPINKASFSCCGADQFRTKLTQLARKQILLCGIEAHVCIYQTTMDLIKLDYEVEVVSDAVSSRTPENKQAAITRMTAAGARLTTTEMALFELLKTADHPQFKPIAKLIK